MKSTTRAADRARRTPIKIRKDLLRAGWTDRAIQRQVVGGAWVRVRHGAYIERKVWVALDRAGRHELEARAVLLQGKTHLVLSHLSAMTLYDLQTWDVAFGDVHVTRTDHKAGRHEAGVQQHRGVILPGDVVERYGVPVMGPTRLALELTTCLDREHALAMVDQLLRRELTTHQLMRDRYRSMERWPHTLLTDLVIRRSDGRHESIGESRFDDSCHTWALPRPEPQFEIRDLSGRVVARVDFALPSYRVWFEFDGLEKYDDLVPEGKTVRDVIKAERKREQDVERITGWICIRITWADLADPVALVSRIRAKLAGRRLAA